MQLTPQLAKDLTLLNLPKYASLPDLKKQYHKFAKVYHPDVVLSQLTEEERKLMGEEKMNKIESKFKELTDAN